MARQRIVEVEAPAQPDDLLGRVVATDACPARVVLPIATQRGRGGRWVLPGLRVVRVVQAVFAHGSGSGWTGPGRGLDVPARVRHCLGAPAYGGSWFRTCHVGPLMPRRRCSTRSTSC